MTQANVAHLKQEIKELKKQVQAAKAEEKFKKIAAMANDAIIQMNDRGKIIFWNNAAKKIFGYTEKQALGKDLHALLVPKKYHSPFKKAFSRFRLDGQGDVIGKQLVLTALRKDQSEFEIELSLSSYQENNHWNSVGIVRDISARIQNERERDRLIDNLKTALDEIKTLKGIVPICASCKKIRDDKGYWNHVEAYVQKHSYAKFSHGICPDCKKELYPQYA